MSHYYEKKDIFPLDGGCACGYVRYRLEDVPIIVHCCHCTSCQRESGTAFAINAVIESSKVTVLPSAAPTVPGSKNHPEEFPAGPVLEVKAISTVQNPLSEEGLDAIRTPSQSQNGQVIVRCPRCASPVWSNYGGGGPFLKFIRVGSLDKAWEIAPDVHIFTRSKREFVELRDGKPQYEKYYPSKEAVYRPESLKRFQQLLPAITAYKEELKARLA
jgi:hypothetical protein